MSGVPRTNELSSYHLDLPFALDRARLGLRRLGLEAPRADVSAGTIIEQTGGDLAERLEGAGPGQDLLHGAVRDAARAVRLVFRSKRQG